MSIPTIAVFDSGFGGLTVLRALLPLIPGARFLYLGDTARLPYGAKSQQTIARYALSSAAFLLAQGAELYVVACNTATALALPELKAALPIPVIGVIEPGVQAAAHIRSQVSSALPSVLVLATTATVQSGAYSVTCRAAELTAYEKACPLLVPLVEEGWIDHPVTADVLRIYLTEALMEAPTVTTLVLGCTHYPLLKPLIERTLAELGQHSAAYRGCRDRDRARCRQAATACWQPRRNDLCVLRDGFDREVPAPRQRVPRPAAAQGGAGRPGGMRSRV